MAQVTLLNRGQRGPGSFETASALVDSTVQTAYIQLSPHQSEMTSTKIVRINIYMSDDGGATWRHDRGTQEQGPWAVAPWLPIPDPQQYLGKRVKAVIDLPEQINCGIVLFVNETPPSPPPPVPLFAKK